jgi:hypothetical protein
VLSFLIFLIEILSTITPSVEPPMTPSVACPNLAEPSHATQTEPNLAEPSQCTQTEPDEPEKLANPNPMKEFVGIDDEGLYIDLGPQHPVPPPSVDEEGVDEEYMSDDESKSDDDIEIEDLDDIVEDREPEQQMSDAEYDKNDPPMTEGTVYANMDAFKIALASHAVKYEFNYDIEKSDTRRYRVSCTFKSKGCNWRIHTSTNKV